MGGKNRPELLKQGHGQGRGTGARTGTGGSRPNLGKGGRSEKRGPTKSVTQRKEAIDAQIELAEYTGVTPLEYMLSVMRNHKLDVTVRLTAARDAAPYVHAKLQSITVKGDPNSPLHNVQLTPNEYQSIVTEALKKI
jgi:hypothetical protein